MASLNKVTLIGNLGSAPQVNMMSNGRSVASVSVATSESWKDRETQERKERTECHRVVFYGPLADVARDHLTKGMQVYIEGQLRTRKYAGSDGIDRYSTEIIASEMKMLGRKTAGELPAAPPAPPVGGTDDDIPF